MCCWKVIGLNAVLISAIPVGKERGLKRGALQTINKKLVGLSLEGQESASPEDVILSADKPVGTITSSVHSPALGRPIALGYVHRDYWKLDTRLIVKHDGSSLDARVTDLPFVPAR